MTILLSLRMCSHEQYFTITIFAMSQYMLCFKVLIFLGIHIRARIWRNVYFIYYKLYLLSIESTYSYVWKSVGIKLKASLRDVELLHLRVVFCAATLSSKN